MKKFENFSNALNNLRLCKNYSAPYDVVYLALFGTLEKELQENWL